MRHSARSVRQQFIDYFYKHGHTHVPSAPLVPQGDPSLMFVNAGMVPFKNVFVGQEARPYKRAVSCQKCMRVSGKHNDLDEVGRTARHHTLFEMLGNFSFGDYFKEEAIVLAWQFLTRELDLRSERMWVTVFAGEGDLPPDDEARTLWRTISGLPDERILSFGSKDNFWSMGDVGPCGPCTEIHVDLGSGPVTPADFESGRIVEIWNNVFMQYERHADGSRVPLPKPAVDTGMGLERVAALCQGEQSNYHSDLFVPLLEAVGDIAGKRYGRRAENEDDVSMRVIADHARALAFLVADGVQPAPDGRGYVLRRIVRRALRHAQRLGIEKSVLPQVAQIVVGEMGDAYPELREASAHIGRVAEQEEEAFRRTLGGGLKVLSVALDGLLADVQSERPAFAVKTLSGELAFKLYDTYGFPKDLTAAIASEHGIALDEEGFDACMASQQARSRGARDVEAAHDEGTYRQILLQHGPTGFVGYPHESHPDDARPGQWRRVDGHLFARCTVVALVGANGREPHMQAGAWAEVVLEPCPFYGEGGGQVGDIGRLLAEDGSAALGEITATRRPLPSLTVAQTKLAAALQEGAVVWAGYPIARRLTTRAHHSATHLLHGALRAVLGEHVTQAGSLVDSDHLRFDFAHSEPMTAAERDAVEDNVNDRIAQASPVFTEEMPIDAARGKGALALFGERYDDEVRVISMGESIELCGGTHAANTGELSLFFLQRDQAVKAGVRRVEAMVSGAAHALTRLWLRRLTALAAELQADKLADELAHAAHDADAQAAARAVADDAEWADVLAAIGRARASIEAASAGLRAARGEAMLHGEGGEDQDGDDEVVAEGDEGDEQAGDDDLGPPLTRWPQTPQALGLHAAQLGSNRDLAFWRPIRTTWAAVLQLCSGRWAEAPDVLARVREHDVGGLCGGVFNLFATEREASRALQQVAARAQAGDAKSLANGAQRLASGIALVCHRLPPGASGDLKQLADKVRDALGSGVVCLAQTADERVTLLVACTRDLAPRVHAGKLMGQLAPHIGGRGGGRPDMAQAGGRDAGGIDEAFAALAEVLSRAP